MKRVGLLVFAMFAFNGIWAQSSNANWDVKVIEYYADGMKLIVPSIQLNKIYTYKNSKEEDSINNIISYQEKHFLDKYRDSVAIEKYKLNNNTRKDELIAIEFWVKPMRKITSNDTFEVGNNIGVINNVNKLKYKSYQLLFFGNKGNQMIKSDYAIEFTKDDIFKLKNENGYYFLGKYPRVENSSFSLKYNTSDTTLDGINVWYNNIIRNYTPYIYAIMPLTYNWFANEFQKMILIDTNKSFFDSLPDFSWKNTNYDMKIDSVFCNRKIIVDTINGKLHYRIQKQYFERPEELKVDTRNNSIMILMSKMKIGSNFQYKLVPWLEYTGDNIPWVNCMINQNSLELKNIPIGSYLLYVKNTTSGQVSDGYKITVYPRWYQTEWFKLLLAIFVGAIGSIFFLRYLKKLQKKKIDIIQKNKTEIDIQLKSLRSQLNPHFIFNALNSIQGLISSTEYEKANEYLVDFSSLLRKPLDTSEINFWTLKDEIELLKTYIKLEQLRTPFDFKLAIENSIQSMNIMFPMMLLQPLVENAIKHALSVLKEPYLLIEIHIQHLDLYVSVQDNGKGFVRDLSSNGFGLSLCEEYLTLINKKYPYTNASLKIISNSEGTNASIILKNWIDE